MLSLCSTDKAHSFLGQFKADLITIALQCVLFKVGQYPTFTGLKKNPRLYLFFRIKLRIIFVRLLKNFF